MANESRSGSNFPHVLSCKAISPGAGLYEHFRSKPTTSFGPFRGLGRLLIWHLLHVHANLGGTGDLAAWLDAYRIMQSKLLVSFPTRGDCTDVAYNLTSGRIEQAKVSPFIPRQR